jgi:hypothetical protein
MDFREDLNIPGTTCPPAGAASGTFIVYRLVDNIPIKIEDIWSYRMLYPTKIFRDECIARACSVYTDCKDLNELRKMPKFRMKKIVIINTNEKDGVFLKTFSRSHLSWWISKEFKLSEVKEAI